MNGRSIDQVGYSSGYWSSDIGGGQYDHNYIQTCQDNTMSQRDAIDQFIHHHHAVRPPPQWDDWEYQEPSYDNYVPVACTEHSFAATHYADYVPHDDSSRRPFQGSSVWLAPSHSLPSHRVQSAQPARRSMNNDDMRRPTSSSSHTTHNIKRYEDGAHSFSFVAPSSHSSLDMNDLKAACGPVDVPGVSLRNQISDSVVTYNIYIYIYIYICTYIYMYVYTHIYVYMHMHMHISIHYSNHSLRMYRKQQTQR